MSKILFITIFVLLLTGVIAGGFFLFQAPSAQTAASDNVYGWAWSGDDTNGGNIGWISFNSKNCDQDNNDYIDSGPCGGNNDASTPIVDDYGVNIESNGNLTGYAWSSNIGRIYMDPSGPYPDGCSSDCTVRVDLSDPSHPITGWARTQNYSTDDSYGWISFHKGTASSLINTTPDPTEFEGWAFGGPNSTGNATSVIGWVSLNCADAGICGQSDYKVWTDYSFNQPPDVYNFRVTNNDSSSLCQQSTNKQNSGDTSNELTYVFAWGADDPDGTLSGNYEIRYKKVPGGSWTTDSFTTSGNTTNLVTSDDPTEPLRFNDEYEIELKAEDNEGAWSDWEPLQGGTLTTAKNRYPYAKFSYSPLDPAVNEDISFDGTLSQAFGAGGSLNNNSYTWDFGDGTTCPADCGGGTRSQPIHSYSSMSPTGYTVHMEVTDQSSYTCSYEETIDIEPQPGEWREVIPR